MKKKILTSVICFALSGLVALGAAGCGGNKEQTQTPGGDQGPTQVSSGRNPETDPLKLAIGAVDQKFNPLFYTAQNDGEIANMTQASLVSSKVVNDAGTDIAVLAYGNSEPCFALDYLETYYDGMGNAIGYGTGDGKVAGSSDTEGHTTYEFVIKKGIKDSMGVDMNVMDVLFNLYVLLDRAYTGSSTLYSTKIKGLQRYRRQDPTLDDDVSGEADNSIYYSRAQERIQDLIDWSEEGGTGTLPADQQKDYEKVKELYEEMLNSDWNTTQQSWVENYKEYNFTAEWQVFLYIEGVVQRQTYINPQGGTSYRTDPETGKYLTTLDPDVNGTVEHQNFIDDIARETAGLSEEEALAARKEYCIEHMMTTNTLPGTIKDVLLKTTTYTTALEYFMADERSQDMPATGGELAVKNISGITVYQSDKLVNRATGTETALGDTYDILKIDITGVDPKARWNFAITVTPMHYYSDAEHYNAAMAAYADGEIYTANAADFGVKCNDVNWLNDIVAAQTKNAVPVGAGAYKAVNNDYSDITQAQIDGGTSTFYDNGITRFARNTYFNTFGSGVENAKINRVQIKVTSDDQIVSALRAGEIDYGTPTATQDNITSVQSDKLRVITYLTGGYGYVGINPKYVPDIEVRRAIMKVFNTSLLINYYGESLVNIIDRPVSTTSWAYPETDSEGNPISRYYEYTTNVNEIRVLITSSGNWRYDSAKRMMVDSGGNQLELTFTLAGETTDHPAYAMFNDAKRVLEQVGLKITVQNDIQALQKLVTGDLAVWAAAWSSSIDPDPYQIYSEDSNASSTRNWYKDGILADGTGQFDEEKAISADLTAEIERGRSTLNQTDREETYTRCYDLIMELAVEFPTYQRYDLFVYDSTVIDASTLTPNPSYLMGPAAELWKVNYLL